MKVENKSEKSVFSIFEHELVPKHIVLSKEEAEEALKKYHIKPYRLPYIKKNDPAIKEIGAKPGDIVKIIRKSPTAGEAVVYRYVIE
ncbi:MAG: DNA-directed RNA polymerase subunit H [Candidatus Bathyarchaeia archaeon]